MLKQLGRYASLNRNIYIAADPTSVDVDHDAHVWCTMFTRRIKCFLYFSITRINLNHI